MHPHKRDAHKAEAHKIEQLQLPTAGAATGEGRLQKMMLHEENADNPLERLEGEQE